MRLLSYSAALSDRVEGLEALAAVRRVPPAKATQTRSPASAYAIAAVEALDLGGEEPALYCVSGPTGSSLHHFDSACDAAKGESLHDADFARRRWRKIHPFTLLLGIQNQVAANLSLRFGWNGPCCNGIESSAAFVDLIPSMELALRERPALVVMSSAGDRREDRSWYRYRTPGKTILEGAVALLFTPGGRLGRINVANVGSRTGALRIGRGASAEPFTKWPVAPCMEAGLAVLWALAQAIDRARFEIAGASRSAYFQWSLA